MIKNDIYTWGAVSASMYLFFTKYIDSILYPNYTGIIIFLPVIIIGFLILNKKTYSKEYKIVDYFFKFVFSLFLFYVPSLLLFTGINISLSESNQTKSKQVELTKIVSNSVKNARIIIKMDNETYFIYGYSPIYEKYKYTPLEKLTTVLYYKEGLFGTKIVQKTIIYEK